MVDEDVALAHRRQHVDLAVGLALLKLRRGHALPRRVAELAEARHRDDVHQVVEPEQAGLLVDLALLELQRLDQHPAQAGVHVGSDLEPDHLAEAAAADLLLDRLEEVVGLVGDVVVGVPGHPEEGVVDDLHPREEIVEVRRDHLLERHEGEPVADREEAAEELLRHLHPRGHLLVLLRVAEQHRDAQREVGDVGEGPAAADHQRSERREHLALEESLDLLSLLGAGVVERDHPDSVLGEAGRRSSAKQRPSRSRSSDRPLADPVDHLARRHPVRSPRVDLALDRLMEPGDADHEELVEVVLVDRGELEPLQQRERGPRRAGGHDH